MKLFTEKLPTLKALYMNQVRTTLSAEEEIVDGLEKMQDAATDSQLQDAFRSHLQESKVHVTRLQHILNRHTNHEADEIRCKTISSLIHEGDDLIRECRGTIRDVALIVAAQRSEHYEMATYGALRNLARVLEFTGDAEAFDQTLHEEEHADHLLTSISNRLNLEAMRAA